MMKQVFLLIFGLLVTASALTANLSKTLFNLNADNAFFYQMIQTRNGVIGFAMDQPNNTNLTVTPQHYLFDIESTTVTPILTDLLTSCGQTNATVLDRLYFHNPTLSLVYYCTSNNSLLILNQDDYTVERSISVSTNSTFAEVKLSTDGYNVAILGMSQLYIPNPSPSHLIRISLQSNEIVSHTVFDNSLIEGEYVTGYDTNGEIIYVLTGNLLVEQGYLKVNIYSMYLLGSFYELTLVTQFLPDFSTKQTFIEFYIVEDLMVTNNVVSGSSNLFFINSEGSTIKVAWGMDSKQPTCLLPTRVAVAVDYTNSNVYTSVFEENSETICDLTRYSINGDAVNFNILNTVSDMQVAVTSGSEASLLFSINATNSTFTITDLQTLDIVYTTIIQPDVIMITNTTYCMHKLAEALYIYDLQTNMIISSITIESNYYYDQDNQAIAFLDWSQNPTDEYSLVIVDLQTGINQTTQTSTDLNFCSGQIVEFSMRNSSSSDLVVQQYDQSYAIVSSQYGLSYFNQSSQEWNETCLLMNFDKMTFYYITGASSQNRTQVELYTYDIQTQNFSLSSSQLLSNTPVGKFISVTTSEVAIFTSSMLAVMDLSSLVPSINKYPFPILSEWDDTSLFKDNNGNPYIILTNTVFSLSSPDSQPEIFDFENISPLFGVDNTTVEAFAGGKCSYWTLYYGSNVDSTRFYNICSKEVHHTIIGK